MDTDQVKEKLTRCANIRENLGTQREIAQAKVGAAEEKKNAAQLRMEKAAIRLEQAHLEHKEALTELEKMTNEVAKFDQTQEKLKATEAEFLNILGRMAAGEAASAASQPRSTISNEVGIAQTLSNTANTSNAAVTVATSVLIPHRTNSTATLHASTRSQLNPSNKVSISAHPPAQYHTPAARDLASIANETNSIIQSTPTPHHLATPRTPSGPVWQITEAQFRDLQQRLPHAVYQGYVAYLRSCKDCGANGYPFKRNRSVPFKYLFFEAWKSRAKGGHIGGATKHDAKRPDSEKTHPHGGVEKTPITREDILLIIAGERPRNPIMFKNADMSEAVDYYELIRDGKLPPLKSVSVSVAPIVGEETFHTPHSPGSYRAGIIQGATADEFDEDEIYVSHGTPKEYGSQSKRRRRSHTTDIEESSEPGSYDASGTNTDYSIGVNSDEQLRRGKRRCIARSEGHTYLEYHQSRHQSLIEDDDGVDNEKIKTEDDV